MECDIFIEINSYFFSPFNLYFEIMAYFRYTNVKGALYKTKGFQIIFYKHIFICFFVFFIDDEEQNGNVRGTATPFLIFVSK